MAAYESAGKSDEWYTPRYIFEMLGVRFDMDVAHPAGMKTLVPASRFLSDDGLIHPWSGFVWMNPPFGHQSTKRLWLKKFFDHGNGLALTPDRTSAPWFREAWWRADAVVFVPKIKFYTPDESGKIVRGGSPGTGSAIWAAGSFAVDTLSNAVEAGLGIMAIPSKIIPENGVVIDAPDRTFEDDLAMPPIARKRHFAPGGKK